MSILFSQFLSNHNAIRPQEADFTEVLSTIALTPKMLYFYGKMPQNRVKNDLKNSIESAQKTHKNTNLATSDSTWKMSKYLTERPKALAIVGTRKPTKYGENIAYELAYEAAKRGIIVISGLAYGIDSIAHRGAVDAGGVTVAVLGTPIDQIYPRSHIGLAEKIIKTGGCIMSETAPGEAFFPKVSFLRRNRLISGLADVVMVPEAAERSGSLNTAAHGLEQGKEVFAAPGDLTRPMSRGCNRLIRQGAMSYLEPNDILELLAPLPKMKKKLAQVELFGDSEAETAILRALKGGLQEGEEILQKTGLVAADFSQTLTMLELKGRIRALGANKWTLK